MLYPNEIWRTWRPIQHHDFFDMFLKPFLNNVCGVTGLIILLKGCTWSAAMFRHVVHVKVTATWMPGPKISQQNTSPGKWHTKTQLSSWRKRKRDSSDRATSFHLWSGFDSHVLIAGAFIALVWGQHEHSEWSASLQPHTQQASVPCVFWCLYILPDSLE